MPSMSVGTTLLARDRADDAAHVWPCAFLGPLPAGTATCVFSCETSELARRARRCQIVAAGADGRARADRHRRDQLGVGSDVHVVLDDGAVLVRAVVVAGDGAGADVDVAADARVADVGQVVGLAARPDRARLDLDEVADVRPRRASDRRRTDPRVRPDAAARADPRVRRCAKTAATVVSVADGDVVEARSAGRSIPHRPASRRPRRCSRRRSRHRSPQLSVPRTSMRAGSASVTPCCIRSRAERRCSERSAAASWARSLTPCTSDASATGTATTATPSLTASATTSVR